MARFSHVKERAPLRFRLSRPLASEERTFLLELSFYSDYFKLRKYYANFGNVWKSLTFPDFCFLFSQTAFQKMQFCNQYGFRICFHPEYNIACMVRGICCFAPPLASS
jgi:hypothetical protein